MTDLFIADNDPIYAIFSNRHEMRRVDLMSYNYAALVSGLHNTIALDFHYEWKTIYWTDVVDDKIYSGKMNGNSEFVCMVVFLSLILLKFFFCCGIEHSKIHCSFQKIA